MKKNRLSRTGIETIAKAARKRWAAFRRARRTGNHRLARKLLGRR